MRAVRLHEIGGVPQVDEIDAPASAESLDVTVAGLNPVDITIGSGRFYGGVPDTPYVIGSEAVGRMADGRRVWVYARGMMAEQAAIDAPERVVEVPEGVSDELAAACGVAGLTGWLAVSWRAPVTPDDTVLVLGASGSLGGTAIQGAKLLGAKHVIGAARRTENVPPEADEVIQIDGSETYPAATVIIDGLWSDPIARALAGAANGVRVVQLGQSAGPAATLQSGWVRGKVANILGFALHQAPSDVFTAGYRELAEHARDGRIRFEVESYALDRIGEAWQRQASGSPGAKIVVAL